MQQWLTPKQMATALQVHPNTVLNWVRGGLVQARRTPTGYWFVPEAELTRLLNLWSSSQYKKQGASHIAERNKKLNRVGRVNATAGGRPSA